MAKEDSVDVIYSKIRSVLDTSNLGKTHKLYSDHRRYMVGYLKSEHVDEELESVVCLKSKVYALQKSKAGLTKKLKGLRRDFTRGLTFEQYKKCALSINREVVVQHSLRSYEHTCRLIQQSLTPLTSLETKRYFTYVFSKNINLVSFQIFVVLDTLCTLWKCDHSILERHGSLLFLPAGKVFLLS